MRRNFSLFPQGGTTSKLKALRMPSHLESQRLQQASPPQTSSETHPTQWCQGTASHTHRRDVGQAGSLMVQEVRRMQTTPPPLLGCWVDSHLDQAEVPQPSLMQKFPLQPL